VAKLTDDQRRALQLLARSPNGCTEAILLAHGFELAMLGKLAFDGFANVERHDGRQPTHEGLLAADHRSGTAGDRLELPAPPEPLDVDRARPTRDRHPPLEADPEEGEVLRQEVHGVSVPAISVRPTGIHLKGQN
jgi:hypothetical protein